MASKMGVALLVRAAIAGLLLSAATACIPAGSPVGSGAVGNPTPAVAPAVAPGTQVAAGPAAGAPSATAEAPAAVPAAVPATVPAPAPIALYAIPRAAESALAYLDSLDTQLGAASEQTAVRRELPAINGALASLDQERSSQPVAEVSSGSLIDWRQDYQRRVERLEALEMRLEKRGGEIQGNLGDIARLIDLWSRTRDQAVSDAAPEVVLARIDDIQTRLTAAGDTARGRLTELLTLLMEVTCRRMAATASLREVDAALRAEQERMFKVESAPLMSALRHDPTRPGIATEFVTAWHDNARAFAHFGAESQDRLLLQAAIFLALAALFAALAPVVRRRAGEDDSLALPAWILGRPVSAAALIALILTLWIHPLAPRAVFRVAMLVLVLPLVRIVPRLLETRRVPGLKSLAVLYLLERLIAFASPHSLLLRLLLLLVTIAAALVVAWEMRRSGGLGGGSGRGGRWERFAGGIALVLLVVSTVANFSGNVTLAELLSRGVLIGAYAGVAFYAAARILESLWAALLATAGARRLDVVIRHGGLLRARGVRYIKVFALLVWFSTVLRLFGLFGPLTEGTGALLRTPWAIGDVSLSPGSIVLFVAMLLVAVTLGRFLRFVIEECILTYVSLPRGVPAAISATTYYVVVGAGLLLAMSASGVAMDRFTFLVGALGVGIGFGLQNVVNNFVSGLILLYERPVQYGDIVELGPILGEVRRIGIRSSTVRTYDGAEVIVPNADLIAKEVVNWTLSDRNRRVEIKIGVAYGTEPARVLALLMAAAAGRPGVLSMPAPVALFEGFGDSSLDFVLRFWTADFDRWILLRSEVRTAVYEAVRAAGIRIPFPQRDLHVRSGALDPKSPA